MSQQEQPFTGGFQKIDFAADGSDGYKPLTTVQPKINGAESSAAVPQGSSEPLKRKRGRPRKFGPGATASPAPAPAARVAPATPPAPASASPAAAFTFAAPAAPAIVPAAPAVAPAVPATPAAPPAAATPLATPPAASASANPVKKGRGRPRGSGTKNPFKGMGSAGISLTPHVITVEAGEDLSTKIMSLSLNGPRNVCILTASGKISNASLRQPAASGGIKTYEGSFQILTLGGSLLFSEHDGQPRRYGGLNVSLSDPDGDVVGGVVAGFLIAASPVQVVLASFPGKLYAPPKMATAGHSSSPSPGTHSESSGGPGSPLNQGYGTCNNIVNNPPQGISGIR